MMYNEGMIRSHKSIVLFDNGNLSFQDQHSASTICMLDISLLLFSSPEETKYLFKAFINYLLSNSNSILFYLIKIDRILFLSKDYRDWIFVPLLIQWIIVNFILYYPYLQFIYRIGTFQQSANSIFPYTWASALILFVYGIILFSKKFKLDAVRTFAYSLSFPFIATSIFEIIWQNIGSGMHIGNQGAITDIVNISSIALIGSYFKFWHIEKYFLYIVILYLTGWIMWMSAGYPQITDSNPVIAQEAFVFNVVLKILTFLMVGIMVIPFFRTHKNFIAADEKAARE